MRSTPAEKISSAVFGVMPEPPAEFSPLAITISSSCCWRSRGTSCLTARRPGSPTMSPMKSSFTRPTVRKRRPTVEWKRITKHQIPNTKLQRNPGIETPKTKLQTPKKSQVPSSKPRPALRAWNLELGASLVLGAWCLEFGLWCLVFGALIGPLSTDGVPFCALRLTFHCAFSVCVSRPLALTWRHANHPMLSDPRSPFATGRPVGSGASGRRLPGRRRRDGHCRQQFSGNADNRAGRQSQLLVERQRALQLAFHSSRTKGTSAKGNDAGAKTPRARAAEHGAEPSGLPESLYHHE